MPAATYGPTAPTTPAPPSLGYGQRAEAPINAVNQWMRTQPWYQALIRSFGQDPNNVHLNDSQKQAVIKAAQANGVVVDEGHNGQEVDDSGNFQAKSHALRNTLIVAGIAAAALATAGAAGVFGGGAAAGGSAGAAGGVEAGVTSGLGAAALPGAGTALTAGTAGAGATAVGAGAAAGGGAAVYGPAAAAGGGGLSVTDALKYGLPTVGNIVGSVIQANAAGKASDAQQKYLEEALAYEKEKDAYDRQTAANKVQLEANRYATYSGNTAPFIANGVTSGNRMTSLLGLPAGAPNAGGSLSGGGGGGGSQGVPVSPEITAKVNDYYKSIGVTPTGPGTGPTDAAYYAGKDAETGGLTDANNAYWFGPNSRIGSDLAKAGVKTGTPTPAPTPSPQATAAQQVTLKGPDGSTKQVPASQLQYWLGKGAQQVSA